MAHKVKITRKQIKQDDRFLATIKGVTRSVITTATDRTWLEANRTALIAGGIALIVVVVAVGGYFLWTGHQRAGAESLMATADGIFRAPVVSAEVLQKNPVLRSIGAYTDASKKWTDAAQAYEKLAATYPRSPAGALAKFYAGNSLYELKKYEEAIADYRKYLDVAGANAPFAGLAKQSIGYAYEAEKKLPEAEKMFQELSADAGSATAFLSLFDLARVYEKENQLDKAVETLKKAEDSDLVKSRQFYEYRMQAEMKIAALEARRGAAS